MITLKSILEAKNSPMRDLQVFWLTQLTFTQSFINKAVFWAMALMKKLAIIRFTFRKVIVTHWKRGKRLFPPPLDKSSQCLVVL
jgi:hypothetical protein